MEECLDGDRRSAECFKITDYYRYLDYLSTNNESLKITDEYIKATGDDFQYVSKDNNVKIQKIKESNYKPNGKKNPEFFDWARKSNKLEPTPIETKTIVNENEVELAFKITNVSYDDYRPRKIDQLMYLDGYSDKNVSIYQDRTTLYFCSIGSRTDFSSQAVEDWTQSNIAILLGVSSNTFSTRFDEEKRLLDEVVLQLSPSIIIFCGHSLGGRLSNELFVYSLVQNKFQPFSVTFNGGSIISVDFTERYNTQYVNSRVLQFHVNYDPLSATNTMGTIVDLPSQYGFSHSLSNFSDFDWSSYDNFIENGLKNTNPLNTIDEVVQEDDTSPLTDQSQENIDITQRLEILGPFYERFYPNGIFTPLDDNRPSNAELYSSNKLINNNYQYPVTPKGLIAQEKYNFIRNLLQSNFKDEYLIYYEKNKYINTNITDIPSSVVPENTKPLTNIGNDLNSTTITDTLLGESNKDISGVLSQPSKLPPQAPREPPITIAGGGRKSGIPDPIFKPDKPNTIYKQEIF